MASTPERTSWPVHNCSVRPFFQGPRQWHALEEYGAVGPAQPWDVSSVVPGGGGSQRSRVAPDYARMVFPSHDDYGRRRLQELDDDERPTRDQRTLSDERRH